MFSVINGLLLICFTKCLVTLLKSTERERALSCIYSLTRWLQQPGIGDRQGRNQKHGTPTKIPTGVARIHTFGPSSAHFPKPQAGRWIGNGAARTQTSLLMQNAMMACSSLTWCSTTFSLLLKIKYRSLCPFYILEMNFIDATRIHCLLYLIFLCALQSA